MSLDKAILHGKEYRKPYYNSKSFDYSCRNHGSCPWCKSNRTHSTNKRRKFCIQQIKEWKQWRENQE